jgi:hypothetical protein
MLGCAAPDRPEAAVTDPDLPPRVADAVESLRTLHRAALADPSLAAPRDEAAERVLARFERVLESLGRAADPGAEPDYEFEGRELITTLHGHYPGLWGAVERRLLWFFGGDCLHFLSDEEIAAFQAEEDGDA